MLIKQLLAPMQAPLQKVQAQVAQAQEAQQLWLQVSL